MCRINAHKLKVLMVDRGYNQASMARALGMTPRTINMYMTNKGTPSYSTMRKLYELLNMNPHLAGEIFFDDALRDAKERTTQ